MLCVCVGDVMDVEVSVCIVRRGAVGARVWGPDLSSIVSSSSSINLTLLSIFFSFLYQHFHMGIQIYYLPFHKSFSSPFHYVHVKPYQLPVLLLLSFSYISHSVFLFSHHLLRLFSSCTDTFDSLFSPTCAISTFILVTSS